MTSTRNIDLVGSLGADHVLDYTRTDFFGSGRRCDLILDTIGNLSVRDLRRALTEGGKAAVVGFSSVAKLMSVSLRGGKDVAMVSAHVTTRDLELIADLIEAGKVHPTSTGAIDSPKSPQQSATWNKATPEGRSSWVRREIRPWSALIPRPQPTVDSGGPGTNIKEAGPQTDRDSEINVRCGPCRRGLRRDGTASLLRLRRRHPLRLAGADRLVDHLPDLLVQPVLLPDAVRGP